MFNAVTKEILPQVPGAKLAAICTDNARDMQCFRSMTDVASIPCLSHHLDKVLKTGPGEGTITATLFACFRQVVSSIKLSAFIQTKINEQFALTCTPALKVKVPNKTRWKSQHLALERFLRIFPQIKLAFTAILNDTSNPDTKTIKCLGDFMELLEIYMTQLGQINESTKEIVDVLNLLESQTLTIAEVINQVLVLLDRLLPSSFTSLDDLDSEKLANDPRINSDKISAAVERVSNTEFDDLDQAPTEKFRKFWLGGEENTEHKKHRNLAPKLLHTIKTTRTTAGRNPREIDIVTPFRLRMLSVLMEYDGIAFLLGKPIALPPKPNNKEKWLILHATGAILSTSKSKFYPQFLNRPMPYDQDPAAMIKASMNILGILSPHEPAPESLGVASTSTAPVQAQSYSSPAPKTTSFQSPSRFHSMALPSEEKKLYDIEAETRKFWESGRNTDLPTLQFWKKNHEQYPTISKLALILFAIPISQTGVERVFSGVSWIAAPRRASMKPSTLKAHIMTKWNFDALNLSFEEIIQASGDASARSFLPEQHDSESEDVQSEESFDEVSEEESMESDESSEARNPKKRKLQL
eukprot:comp18064_c0_seq1/m.31601 comp18064_c0_seq1/g.31601  ORF comp18064_c0_seq1/g.31601 comp18064_c0_seq1/m.31601 type:complete len:582 (+) comp18064_c0_seq1:2-1747(+)